MFRQQAKIALRTTPDIYLFTPDTHEYTITSQPDPDQRDPSTWVYPAFYTKQEPPEHKDGFTRVFDEQSKAWQQITDHRGENWFTQEGEEVEIKELGNPANKGFLQEQPPILELPLPNITKRQVKLWLLQNGYNPKTYPIELIAKIPDDTLKQQAEIEWEDGTY